MNNKIPGKQLSSWLLTALTGPVLSVIGRTSAITALIVAAICGALSFCILSCKQIKLPRWLCVLELGWLTVFLGGLARSSGTCWTDADAFPVIPIVLLILSALAAQRGAAQPARIGSVLTWLTIPIIGIVALAGAADINPKWISLELTIPDGMTVALLLIPCLGLFIPQSHAKGAKWISLLLGGVAVLASILMDGTMSRGVAATAENTFYEFSKGITLLGVAERFEALIACVLAGGWFALFTIILSAVYHLTEEIAPKVARWNVWLCAAISAALMCILPNKVEWMAVGSLIFWGFLPVAAQGLGGIKNIVKK